MALKVALQAAERAKRHAENAKQKACEANRVLEARLDVFMSLYNVVGESTIKLTGRVAFQTAKVALLASRAVSRAALETEAVPVVQTTPPVEQTPPSESQAEVVSDKKSSSKSEDAMASEDEEKSSSENQAEEASEEEESVEEEEDEDRIPLLESQAEEESSDDDESEEELEHFPGSYVVEASDDENGESGRNRLIISRLTPLQAQTEA